MNTTNTIELAIFEINESSLNQLSDHQEKLNEDVSRLPGLCSQRTLRSLKDQKVFADVIEWDSMESARKAAETMKDHPFMQLIEKLVLFEHFSMNGEPFKVSNPVKNEVWEVAVGSIDKNKTDQFSQLRPILFDKIAELEGFKEASSLISQKNPEKIVDLLRWQSMDLASEAMEEIHKVEECRLFMDTYAEDHFFDHMELIYFYDK